MKGCCKYNIFKQTESLCGFNIVSDIKSSTASGTSERKTSTVAQAIANVANIGSVGSGRKLSDSTSPPVVAVAGTSLINNDPPPTYSSVAVKSYSPNLAESRPTGSTKAESMDPNSVSSKTESDCDLDRKALVNSLNGGSVVTNGSSHLVILNGNDPLINGNMDSFSGSNHSPPANKTRKRISWFGSNNKRDSWAIVEADSANGDSEEEKRRKKIKWLWKSAALKSTAKRKELLHSENSTIS